MTFTWKEKKATIRTTLAKVLRLDTPNLAVELADGTFENAAAESIQWENERYAARPTRGIWCDLRLGSIIPIGQDEIRYEYELSTDRLLPTYGGPRRFSVMVIIGCDEQEDIEAIGDVAGRLRTRIMREEYLDMLFATDIGLTRLGMTMNVDYMDDGRMYSQSMTEVFFETNEQDAPTADDLGDYINRVEGGGTVETGFDLIDLEPVFDVTGPVD